MTRLHIRFDHAEFEIEDTDQAFALTQFNRFLTFKGVIGAASQPGAPDAPVPVETDDAFRARIQQVVRPGNVNWYRAVNDVGPKLDELGAFYELKRKGTD